MKKETLRREVHLKSEGRRERVKVKVKVEKEKSNVNQAIFVHYRWNRLQCK